MFQRSTKGASKQRRDCINAEIQLIRDLLPVTEVIRQRLSQLQVMSLCNAYIAKSTSLEYSMPRHDPRSREIIDIFDFSQALPGFLLLLGLDGKILYISENISEYLGHSMVEMITQSETVYDIIDGQDTSLFREILHAATNCQLNLLDELNFSCRMNIPRKRQPGHERYKAMKICGRLMWPRNDVSSQPVFVSICSPHIGVYTTCSSSATFLNTMIFCTEHTPDLKVIDIDDKGEFHLGYNRSDVIKKSWYEIIHPVDVEECRGKHSDVVHGRPSRAHAMCVRVQTQQGQFLWLHTIMELHCENDVPSRISCVNHIIYEEEVAEIKRRDAMEDDLVEDQTDEPTERCLPTVTLQKGSGPFEIFLQPSRTKSADVKKQLISMIQRKSSRRLSDVSSESDSTSSESDWTISPNTGTAQHHSPLTLLHPDVRRPQTNRTNQAPGVNKRGLDMELVKLEDDDSFFGVARKKLAMSTENQLQTLPELDQVVIEDFFSQVLSPPDLHSSDVKNEERNVWSEEKKSSDMNPLFEMIELGDETLEYTTNSKDESDMMETILQNNDFPSLNFENFSTMGELFYDNIDHFSNFKGCAPLQHMVLV